MLEKLSADLKTALKAGEKIKLLTIRGLMTDLKKERGIKNEDLNEAETMAVLKRCAKMRRDSIEQYRNGNREDLAAQEEAELAIIETYLPQQMSDEKIEQTVLAIIEETGATGKGDFGKVMKTLMSRHSSEIDGGKARAMITKFLN